LQIRVVSSVAVIQVTAGAQRGIRAVRADAAPPGGAFRSSASKRIGNLGFEARIRHSDNDQ
jgi:hypothetical protein